MILAVVKAALAARALVNRCENSRGSLALGYCLRFVKTEVFLNHLLKTNGLQLNGWNTTEFQFWLENVTRASVYYCRWFYIQ